MEDPEPDGGQEKSDSFINKSDFSENPLIEVIKSGIESNSIQLPAMKLEQILTTNRVDQIIFINKTCEDALTHQFKYSSPEILINKIINLIVSIKLIIRNHRLYAEINSSWRNSLTHIGYMYFCLGHMYAETENLDIVFRYFNESLKTNSISTRRTLIITDYMTNNSRIRDTLSTRHRAKLDIKYRLFNTVFEMVGIPNYTQVIQEIRAEFNYPS